MLSCKLTNDPGYVYLLLDHEDMVQGAFTTVQAAVESLELSVPPEILSRMHLEHRIVKDHAYAVIEVDQESVALQKDLGPEYYGCISKQRLREHALKIEGF